MLHSKKRLALPDSAPWALSAGNVSDWLAVPVFDERELGVEGRRECGGEGVEVYFIWDDWVLAFF